MATAGNAQRKIRTVMMRGRSYFRGKDKSVLGIDSGMLLKSKVRDIVFNRPVGIEIARIFRIFPFLSRFPSGVSLFCFSSSSFSFTDGMAGRLYQAGIDGYAFVDG